MHQIRLGCSQLLNMKHERPNEWDNAQYASCSNGVSEA